MHYGVNDGIRTIIAGYIAQKAIKMSAFCLASGISHPILSRVMSGKRDAVDEATWAKLCRAIPSLKEKTSAKREVTYPHTHEFLVMESELERFKGRARGKVMASATLSDAAKLEVLRILEDSKDAPRQA